MKERKTWQKRIVSLLMALAMVVTQIGVWNAGKESVQAAEMSQVTFYFEYDGAKTLAVGYTGKNDTYGNSGWLFEDTTKWINYYKLDRLENSNWYQTTISFNKTSINESRVGLSLCELSEKDGGYVVDSVLETYSNSLNAEAYQKIFDGTYFDPAIQKNDRSSVISYASLTSGNENKDDDENETYTVEITPDATSVEAGAEVTLTATVKKGNTIVSNLQEAD